MTAGSVVSSGAPHGSGRAQAVLSPSAAGSHPSLVTEGDKQLPASLRTVKAACWPWCRCVTNA